MRPLQTPVVACLLSLEFATASAAGAARTPEAAVTIEVRQPARVRAAARENPWLQDVLAKPLGRGLTGPWAAFLGTRGSDLKASFAESILDVVADRLLASPWRLVWFAGADAPASPALIVAAPGAEARAAYQAIDAVAHKGGGDERCAGGSASAYELHRWTVAEHTVFAALLADRIVLGREGGAVRDGACLDLGQASRPSPKADLAVVVVPDNLGREAQLLAHLLGLGREARFEFAVEGPSLVPQGIAAELLDPGRLDVAGLPRELLRLVPEETPVVLSLALRLPADLAGGALERYVATGLSDPSSDLATRQVVLVWTPRGDPRLTSEVALLWSRPKDRCALEEVFAGAGGPSPQPANRLTTREAGTSLVLASSPELVARLMRTREGKRPSLLHHSPVVLAGLRARASLGLGLNLGRLLSQLVLDGYRVEAREREEGAPPLPKAPPPEVERARRDLEALPFLGFRGVLHRGRLTPRGYRS